MTWGGEELRAATAEGEEAATADGEEAATAEGEERGEEEAQGGEEGEEEGQGAAQVDEFEHGAVGGGDNQRDEPREEEADVAPGRPNLFGAFAFAGGAATSSSGLARRRRV